MHRAYQAPLSMGFSRQEYWSGLLCPPPGDLPKPGIEPGSPMSPALAGGFFTTRATWEFLWTNWSLLIVNEYISWIYYFSPRKPSSCIFVFLLCLWSRGELRLTCIWQGGRLCGMHGLFSWPGTEPASPAGRVYLHREAGAVDVSDEAIALDPCADILHDLL